MAAEEWQACKLDDDTRALPLISNIASVVRVFGPDIGLSSFREREIGLLI